MSNEQYFRERLREVEAERDEIKRINEFDTVVPIQELQEALERERARVERLEADLQEATAALQWIETRLSRHREPRVEAIDKALERARGVLRKGETGAG